MDRVIEAGSRPIPAPRRSSRAPRGTPAPLSPPGMVPTSAGPAAHRTVAGVHPPSPNSGAGGRAVQWCPVWEDRRVGLPADGHEVVEQPRVLDVRDRVRLPPDPQHVVVADLLRGRRDPETRLAELPAGATQAAVRHDVSPIMTSGTLLRSTYGALFRLSTWARKNLSEEGSVPVAGA